jgi:hypothetical protein
MQNFIEAGDLKVNEIKVRLDKLPSILNKYESAQKELECLDEADYSLDREFETQYYQVKAKFNEILHPVVELPQPRHSSSQSSSSESRLIAMMHAKHLCQMPQVKKSNASSIRQLINHVSSHINAIQALSVNVPVQDLILNHLMTATLDNETLQQWEQFTTNRMELPTTTELITFLEALCRTLELIQNTQSSSTATVSPRAQQSAKAKVSKFSYCNVVTPTQCTLCNESRRLFKCDKFLNIQPRQRHNYAKQQGLCFNCLQPYFKGHTCSQQQCHICHRGHHTLLHIAKQPQVANANRLATNTSSPSPAQGSTGAQVNTYHTLKGKSRNHVLLATAVVEVRDKSGQYIPCRALLDSGSQSHFITEVSTTFTVTKNPNTLLSSGNK